MSELRKLGSESAFDSDEIKAPALQLAKTA